MNGTSIVHLGCRHPLGIGARGMIDDIRTLCRDRGISVAELAEEAELSYGYVADIMRGTRTPPEDTLVHLHRAASGLKGIRSVYDRCCALVRQGHRATDVGLAMGIDPGRVRKWASGKCKPRSLAISAIDDAGTSD